jgi:hypothetical protein
VGSYLRKDQQGHQFQYVGSSQVLGIIREAMDANGLILSVSITGHSLVTKWSVGDSKEHLTELDIVFTWINVDDPPDRMEWHGYGQGLDTGEKGVGKALTYAEKYGLLKFFHIATDKDDPDAFQDRVEQAKPQERTIGPQGAKTLMAVAKDIAKAHAARHSDESKRDQVEHTKLGELKTVVNEWTHKHGAATVPDLTTSQGAELTEQLEELLAAAQAAAAEDPTGTFSHATDGEPLQPDFSGIGSQAEQIAQEAMVDA